MFEIEEAEESLVDAFARSATAFPDRAALISDTWSPSYRELADVSDRVATFLTAHDSGRSTRVAVLMEHDGAQDRLAKCDSEQARAKQHKAGRGYREESTGHEVMIAHGTPAARECWSLSHSSQMSLRPLSLSEIKSEHIGGVIRQELALAECARRSEQLVVPARPCSEIDVSERRCNTACMKGVRDAGAARRTR
jgi:hypothetical protein